MIGFSRGAYLCRAFALILDRIGMIPADLVVDASGTRGYDLLSIALDAYIDLFRGRRLVKARDDIETITRMLRAARTGQDGTSSAGGTIVHALGLFDSVCAFSWPRSLYGKGGDYIWRRMFGDDASDELCPPNVEHAFRELLHRCTDS